MKKQRMKQKFADAGKQSALRKTDVSGSASSEPNPVAQPQMWVDWYRIVYGGNEQDAKKAWGKKMYLLGY